jgi:hypothetical protein
MGQPSANLLKAVRAEAAARGWSAQDLLGVIGYETGGTYNSWQKGPTTKWGEHRGFIQWGEPQREQYGVTREMSEADQVKAMGSYLTDRGMTPGMGILPMYAAINGGNVAAIHASDENAGGAPGTVTDKVLSSNFSDHMRNSANYLGEDYVPTVVSGVPQEGRGSSAYNAEYELPTEGEVPEMEADPIASFLTNALMGSLKGSPAPPPPPLNMNTPPPPQMRARDTGPTVLVRKKPEKKGDA